MEWDWKIREHGLELETHGYLVTLLFGDKDILLLIDTDNNEDAGFYHIFKKREKLRNIEKWLDKKFISEVV